MSPIIFNLLQIPNIIKKYSRKRVNIRFIFFYMCHTFKIMIGRRGIKQDRISFIWEQREIITWLSRTVRKPLWLQIVLVNRTIHSSPVSIKQSFCKGMLCYWLFSWKMWGCIWSWSQQCQEHCPWNTNCLKFTKKRV